MTDKEKLEKLKNLADAMYYAAQYLTTDASRLHKAMDEYHQFIINEYHKEEPTIPDIVDEHFYEMLGEEPASEDLTDEIRKVVIENLFACTEPSELKKERVIEIANEITPFVVKVAKEYMLKDSVDAECSTLLYANGDEVRYAVQYPKGKRPVNRGDKVKVIVIKED